VFDGKVLTIVSDQSLKTLQCLESTQKMTVKDGDSTEFSKSIQGYVFKTTNRNNQTITAGILTPDSEV
jgi:hypothetical protein